MLPTRHRLRRQPDFTAALRHGRRAGGGLLVVSVLPAGTCSAECPARVGFVVGRWVGPAVVRNRLRRRLRHLMSARLDPLPPGSRVVVRGLPPAAGRPSTDLAGELDGLLRRVAQ